MNNNPEIKLEEEIIKEFRVKWERICKTMTGHISGRKIWDTSDGDDSEDSYVYVDETLEKWLLSKLREARVETLEEVELWVEEHTRDYDGAINLDDILDKKEILQKLSELKEK